jgi:hypothetical protein
MKDRLQIIDQTLDAAALVDLRLSPEMAESLRNSPEGTLELFASVVTSALSRAGVELELPVTASVQSTTTIEEMLRASDYNRLRIHESVEAGQEERNLGKPLSTLDSILDDQANYW